MSLFRWLFPAPKPVKAQPESSGLSRMEATRPVARNLAGNEPAPANGQPANRKGERMARRELLYTVVREAMNRAGVLSASYKFKVLSLDPRGRQFLVMVDLARDSGCDTSRLSEIEALIAQGAKSRHDIVVTAVYWRTNDHVAVGDPREPVPERATGHPVSRFEPIQTEEVEAFKRALAAGVANPAAAAAAAVNVSHGATATDFDGAGKHGPQSYTLLTGFEDTEMADGDQRMPALSRTQYGDLN